MRNRKNHLVPLVLLAFFLTSCAPATNQPEPIPTPEIPELRLDFSLGDGESVSVSSLTREEREQLEQSEDYVEQFLHRLEENGVHLTIGDTASFFSVMNADIPAYFALPVSVFHHKTFDILTVHYPGYKADSGDLYVFENGVYRGVIEGYGHLDFDDCIREVGNTVWFVTSWHNNGTGMGIVTKTWRNLTAEGFPLELDYTQNYGNGNLMFQLDLGFQLDFRYSAWEEELFVDEQGIPTLRLGWELTLTDQNVVTVTDSGTQDLPLCELETRDFLQEDLSHRFRGEIHLQDFIHGLQEQLEAYIQTGTEEQRYVARQILNNFLPQ